MEIEIGKRYKWKTSDYVITIVFINDEIVFYKVGNQYDFMSVGGFISNHEEYREEATMKKIIEEKRYWIEKGDNRMGFIGTHFNGTKLISNDGQVWGDEDLKDWFLV
jgi:hypothetical protein